MPHRCAESAAPELSVSVVSHGHGLMLRELLGDLAGISGVSFEVIITVNVPDVKKKIEDALSRHAKVEAQAIRVTVRDGNKVSLEGKVESWDEREAVEDAAWSVAGVQSVDDRLAIVR